MNAYVDASALLRVVLGQSAPLADWSEIDQPISSVLIRAEARRAIGRARLRGDLDDDEVAGKLQTLERQLGAFLLAPLDGEILRRAGDPFPTAISTLDAIHLATALRSREDIDDLVLATHDSELARGGRAYGFVVYGV